MAGGKYYAVYPSSAIIKWNLTDDAAEVSGPFCTVNIPKKQIATVGSWDPKAALLVASSQTNQMAFKHGVSYVRFEVTEQTGNFVSAWLVAQNKEKLSDPQAVVEFGTSGEVLDMLKNDFVVVALYTDDKQKLDKEDWVTDAETGKVYKDLGRANSYTARTLWNVNAQPNYVLLSPSGEILVPVRGYDLSVDGFVNFLQSGLDAYAAK